MPPSLLVGDQLLDVVDTDDSERREDLLALDAAREGRVMVGRS